MTIITILRERKLKNGLHRPCGLHRQRRRGSGLIEFAMVSPFLLAMLLGIIDFGWRERNTLIIANAAREGARAAALGQVESEIKRRVVNASASVLETDAQGNISNGSVDLKAATTSSNTPTYGPWPADKNNPPRNGVEPGYYLRVTVIYNHRSITGLFNSPITVPVVMRRET